MTRRQYGFTLVEIAIVLVIIGLLLGGILKGQELINSARVRNIADMNSGIQAAYFGFIDRYRAVPGDMCKDAATKALGTEVTSGGNGDGSLNGKKTGSCTDSEDNSVWREASALWEQLWKAGFIQGSYNGNASGEETYRGRAPINPFNGDLVLFRTKDYQDWDGTAPKDATSDRLNLALGRFIPVNIARELDVKVDDARPFSGVLRLARSADKGTFDTLNVQDPESSPCHGDIDQDGKENANANEYNIKANSDDCTLVYLY